jgi:hypothetical protein
MSQFEHIAMKSHLDSWVTRVQDPDLSRAWDLVGLCIKAHARCDREDGQSAQQAAREAWEDWAWAVEGGRATPTMRGLVAELRMMAPCDRSANDTLEHRLREAIAMARGEQPVFIASQNPQPLRLIKG